MRVILRGGMAVARESISPLLKNAHTRRVSLELRQKFGNHILSPSSGGLSPSRHQVNAYMNWSPGKSVCSDNPLQNGSSFSHRRGSADQDVFKSLSPCGGMSACGKHSRRRSLTPLNAHNNNVVGPPFLLQDLPFSIPSIKIQDAPHFQSPKSNEAPGERSVPTPRRSSNFGEIGLFRSVIPIPFTEQVDKNQNVSHSPAPTITALGARRKSSSSRYDFDEDFMRFVVVRCNLQLHPEEVLGRGSFGTVIQGNYHGHMVAVKIIKTNTPAHLESTKGEQNAFGLAHPHIAKVLDIFQMGPERALVVMDLMKKGNLLKLLNDSRTSIQASVKIRIAGQIASALQYCHQKDILHLDVKPQNILLDVNDNCKLSDFGTSKKSSEALTMSNVNRLEGTVAYKAPELFQGHIPTDKCDVYSFGICMWQILHREEPYPGLPEHAIIYQVVAQGLRPDRFACSADLIDVHSPGQLLQFISLYKICWHSEPEYRPDMKNIVERLLLMLCKAGRGSVCDTLHILYPHLHDPEDSLPPAPSRRLYTAPTLPPSLPEPLSTGIWKKKKLLWEVGIYSSEEFTSVVGVR
ncbi:unnamed protein product [Allacma fusca]|uniref:non-specific serine/threonine protein kinase n=1 Tax=Allacma fusca TaxID=39272 RepID=A0A8J2JVE8_9HEXA|nr:unnamed protein product [Allacma fusca]